MNAARSIVFGGFLQLATLAAVCAVACPPGHAATIRDLLGPAQTSASAGFDFPFNPLGGFANFRDYATITAPGMSGTFTSDSGVLLHPVPEPSAWAMMISGIVALGFAARRRRAV